MPDAAARVRWRNALERRLAALTLLSCLGATLPWWAQALPGATLAWLGDLALHWQWLYAALGALAGVLWVAVAQGRGRHRALAALLVLGLCVAANLRWAVLPALAAAPLSAPSAQGIRLVSFNVNLNNTRSADILAWVDQQQADVVALLEVTPDMQPLLAGMAQRYPYRAEQAAPDPFGMAVYSRLPWRDVQFVQPPGATPHFSAVLAQPAAGGAFQLTVVHPMPPISAADQRARDELFSQLGAALPGSAPPRVLMGDFNSTPWAIGLRRLHDAGWARATGLAPTYSLLRSLPIDHILATRAHWQVAASGVGPWLGSDHRPVWAVLQPVQAAAP